MLHIDCGSEPTGQKLRKLAVVLFLCVLGILAVVNGTEDEELINKILHFKIPGGDEPASCSAEHVARFCGKNTRCRVQSWSNAPQLQVCECLPGYEKTSISTPPDSVLRCSDVDECELRRHRCGQTCTNYGGSFRCECRYGFMLAADNVTCVWLEDHDECESQPCAPYAICEDLLGDYSCHCPPGFEGDGVTRCAIRTCLEEFWGDACEHVCHCKEEAQCHRQYGTCPDGCDDGFYGDQCHLVVARRGHLILGNFSCQHGGTALEVWSYSQVLAGRDFGFRCLCDEGYTGKRCEKLVTPCDAQPCKNGGSCRNEGENYKCTCLSGLTGSTCDEEIDECSSSPCHGSSTCVDEGLYFSCLCAKGFIGILCDIDIDECSSQPCKNNGTCTDVVNGYNCTCTNNWAGRFCEFRINVPECTELQPPPCGNHGECIELEIGYECQCSPGFTGMHCDVEVDECESTPCVQNSTCIDKVASYVCNCVQGFTGVNCGSDLDECEDVSGTCNHGGECTNTFGGFQCACADGWSGHRCNVDRDECAELGSVCHNQATCDNQPGSYRCICGPGWEGALCSNNTNECSALTKPCHHGTCNDTVGSFLCSCSPGYGGAACAENVNECTFEPYPCVSIENGQCVDQHGSFYCHCKEDFSGDNCSIFVRVCVDQKCSDHGTCIPTLTGYKCECEIGFTGTDCETEQMCEEHQWGAECDNFCYCIDDERCDRITGICPERCDSITGICSNQCNYLLHYYDDYERILLMKQCNIEFVRPTSDECEECAAKASCCYRDWSKVAWTESTVNPVYCGACPLCSNSTDCTKLSEQLVCNSTTKYCTEYEYNQDDVDEGGEDVYDVQEYYDADDADYYDY